MIANLIAAAIIYLCGAAAGLFEPSPALIGTATTVLALTVCALFLLLSRFVRGSRRAVSGGIGGIALGIAMISAAAFQARGDLAGRILIIVTGAAAGLAGAGMILTRRAADLPDPPRTTDQARTADPPRTTDQARTTDRAQAAGVSE
ncbi:hypothetical protein [Pseudosporangium ferrugineum]|uniref:Uncharacterized protein n=1 Tax=Pseudosporangium ferrugineum TaxID=439699 RepID=A0A2T0R764_9ACTN|nr:hypothetical protein [Pseudosporangium ferrugineum]PRY17015.1 hypothetical protein CLV70_1561 [Pseudosporangium ferrugineum]